jgi:hypothetical protein
MGGDRPADLRIIRWVLAVCIVGTGCGCAAMILTFGYAGTRAGGMLTAAHWLTWCVWACFAVVVAVGLVLTWRRP